MEAADSAETDRRTTGSLFSDLARQGGALFGDEVALAQAELREKWRAVKTGAFLLVFGWSLLCVGLVIMMAALVLALATVVAAWLAAVIVGTSLIVLGAIIYAIGHRYFLIANLRPERTLRSLRGDLE